MEHNDRNDTIRLKILNEIADIEAFTAQRSIEELASDRMYQNIGELN